MSAEFLFLFGVLIIIIMISIVFISGENELNTAMEAARNGVIEGVTTSSSAVYPENDAYAEYSDRKEGLLTPYSVDIVNISYEEFGFDNGYDKKQIQFQVYAKTSDRFDSEELVSIGDRINYYLRKSIAISFNTTDSTNNLYNPVFSPHYVFTTANVKWL
ncbi:hypothetical protein [Methanobrevibacter sp.]|uniref:hypothetical protein n=1 Tax=Methanobrevibacter sp. TaxID=66852 RepID=UPI00388F8F08